MKILSFVFVCRKYYIFNFKIYFFLNLKYLKNVDKSTIVCSLARSNKADIERANEALSFAERFRIHTFIATSELHMKYKLQMTRNEVIQQIKDSVSYARNFTDDVEVNLAGI